MYNRYIPQQDGTYQKNRIQSQTITPVQDPPCPPPSTNDPEMTECRKTESAGNFLRQLLPKNVDTSDLLIIVLLLLLAGDCEENRNTWLLTLALYLFL